MEKLGTTEDEEDEEAVCWRERERVPSVRGVAS
jgi:hypothetical protein